MSSIVQHTTCPWCGGNDRVAFDEVDTKTNAYVEALEKTAKVADGTIMDVATYRCVDCDTVYLSSFFDDLTVGETFSLQTSAHNNGWLSFHSNSGMLADKRIEKQKKKDSIKAHLLEYIPRDDGIYVEFGCPFSGLIHEVALGLGNEDVVAKRYSRFLVDSVESNEAAFSTFIWPRSGLLSFFGRQFHKALKRHSTKVANSGGTRATPPVGTKDVYLVKPDSRFIWNDNCTSNFASCVATALAVYGAKRIRTEEIEGIADGRHITIGFYNTLDHLEDPRALLERCVEIADTVIVETHGYHHGGGRQHQFFLNDTLPTWATKKGWILRDHTADLLAKRPQYGNFFFVISKGDVSQA